MDPQRAKAKNTLLQSIFSLDVVKSLTEFLCINLVYIREHAHEGAPHAPCGMEHTQRLRLSQKIKSKLLDQLKNKSNLVVMHPEFKIYRARMSFYCQSSWGEITS